MPENEVLAQAQEIVRNANDIDAGEENSAVEGVDLPAADDGGNDPRPSEVDQQEPDPEASMDDAAEVDQEGDPADTAEPGEGVDDGPILATEVAEKLGIDAKDLFEGMHCKVGKDQTLSLSELVDHYKEHGPVEERAQALDTRQRDLERRDLQTRAELQQYLQNLPPHLQQTLARDAASAYQGYAKEQEELVLETIPEWKDPDARASAREGIVAIGHRYGFSEAEMTFTHDARTLHMLHDFVKLRGELEGIKAAAKKRPGKPNRPGRPGKQNNRKLADLIRGAKGAKGHAQQMSAATEVVRKLNNG